MRFGCRIGRQCRNGLAIITLVFCVVSPFNVRDVRAASSTELPFKVDSSEASVLTCTPNPAFLYALFGHTALRIVDPGSGLDVCFNFGIFDDSMPGFYWDYIKGRMHYVMGVADTDRFLEDYRRAGQTVFEQKLNLTIAEKQKLIADLQTRLGTDGRSYPYHYFTNNCSTKVWQVLRHAIVGELRSLDQTVTNRQSIREMLRFYLDAQPWAGTGLNLVLGSSVDQPAQGAERFFLPLDLKKGLARVEIQDGDRWRPLVLPSRTLFEGASGQGAQTSWWQRPFSVIALISTVLVSISIGLPHWRRLNTCFDASLMVLFGSAGIILGFLWLCTAHSDTSGNANLLWANPLYLVMAGFLFTRSPFRLVLCQALVASGIAFLFASIVIRQHAEPEWIPLILAMIFRCWRRCAVIASSMKRTAISVTPP